jgi:NAD(P)-dependent dehydrogenase (short-subunit alcohol dehydrogenase family)
VAYAASKAALNALSLSLARTLAPEVRVNVVAPGYVDTPWQHAMLGADKARAAAERYASFVPLKDYARPADVADAVAWLLEGARMVTGEVLFVDGGLHATPPR